jgi:CRISPR-associated protein Cpf1
MSNLSNFTGLYPISKTLRFELIPQGKTLEHIEKSDILKNDNQRADDYKEVK